MFTSRVFMAGILGLVILASSQVDGVGQSTSVTEQPRAVVPEPTHDFGTLEQGGRVTHSFTIRNQGTAPLTIARVDLSQPSMQTRFKGVIPAGGEGQIAIEWDTTRFSGDLEAEAIVHVDDPVQPRLRLSLKGIVRSPIDLVPYPAVYFSVFRDETAEQKVTIVNNEERPLKIEQIRPEGDHFAAEIKTVEPGKIYELLVKVPKGLPAGRYMERVQVDTDHPRRSHLSVAVNVFVKNDLYASPEFVDFEQLSSQQVRNPALTKLLTHSFMVKKRRGDFAITAISSDVSGLRIQRSPSSNDPSGSFKIDVAVIPEQARPGSLEGSIRIRTNDTDFPELVIPVRGSVR